MQIDIFELLNTQPVQTKQVPVWISDGLTYIWEIEGRIYKRTPYAWYDDKGGIFDYWPDGDNKKIVGVEAQYMKLENDKYVHDHFKKFDSKADFRKYNQSLSNKDLLMGWC